MSAKISASIIHHSKSNQKTVFNQLWMDKMFQDAADCVEEAPGSPVEAKCKCVFVIAITDCIVFNFLVILLF